MEAAATEKRRFPRIEFKSPLQYRLRGTRGYRNTIAEDVSLGGLRFSDNYFVAPKSHLNLEFNALNRLIQAVGKVVWVSHIPHTDRYRYGVEFIGSDRQNLSFLNDFIMLRTGAI